MLQKILEIKNVGRFKSYNASGDVELKKYNLIFAPNGRGKTTLSAIIRSLSTGNPGFILERKTLGQTDLPNVQIRLGDKNYRFNDSAWSELHTHFAIFDANYINSNVCAGDFVDIEHKRNLYKVIIGAQGINYNQKVEDIGKKITGKNTELKDVKLQIRVPTYISFENFISLLRLEDFDNKIAQKKTELDAANKAKEIQEKSLLKTLILSKLPEEYIKKLSSTFDEISDEAATKVTEHMQHHNMDKLGLKWLAKGNVYTVSKDCPFCGQDITANELIQTYKTCFNNAYNQFEADIKTISTKIDALFGEEVCINHTRTIESNNLLCEYWKGFLELEAFPDLALLKSEIIKEYRIQINDLFSKKLSNILAPVTFDEAFKQAESNFLNLVEHADKYNSLIKSANEKISNLKKQTASANILTLTQELNILLATQARYETTMDALCTSYTSLQNEKLLLEKQKIEAKRDLDTYTETVIGKYEGSLNKLLEKFGADFRITNTKNAYPGGIASSSYQILINGTPVDIGDAAMPVGQTCFRNTLSAGDKSTLALAFFLTELEHDVDKADKIVIFDDPFNSQDRTRRNCTKDLITGTSCKQVIVLSHEQYFLKLIWDSIDKSQTRALQFIRHEGINTTICSWDIDRDTKDIYFVLHEELQEFIDKGHSRLREIAQKIRPLLEGFCRYKTPNKFPDGKWLGEMIGIVKDKGTTHPIHNIIEELEAINDFSKKYHHDTNSGVDSELLDDGELKSFVARTLKIVDGVV